MTVKQKEEIFKMVLAFSETRGIAFCSACHGQSQLSVTLPRNWTLHRGQKPNGKETKVRLTGNQCLLDTNGLPTIYLAFLKNWNKRRLQITIEIKIGADFSSYNLIECTLSKTSRREGDIDYLEKIEIIEDYPFLQGMDLKIVD